MGGLVEHFGSPMINQGMQQTISVFNLGGVVQHFSSPTGNPISTFGNPISAFADGGSTDTDNSEQAKDLRDIKSLINEYRKCLMQKAVCCASDRMMQSHVYKQKAMECKLRASKLIDSYHEKYGGMENSPFTMVDMDEMNQYADNGEFGLGGFVAGALVGAGATYFLGNSESGKTQTKVQASNKEVRQVKKLSAKQEAIVDFYYRIMKGDLSYAINEGYLDTSKIKDPKLTTLANSFKTNTKALEEYIDKNDPSDEIYSTASALDKEGLDYGFLSGQYNSWKTIKDIKFQSLLKKAKTSYSNILAHLKAKYSLKDLDETSLENAITEIEGGKFADGGEMVIRYSVYDEEGDLVEMGLSASELIELASTIYYYDAMDTDEENISTLDEAMDGFEAMGYSVRESEYGFADGGKTKERVYIDFLNKKKNFQKDRKYFDSYDEARNWAIKTMDKFNPDMIKYEFADGGAVVAGKLTDEIKIGDVVRGRWNKTMQWRNGIFKGETENGFEVYDFEIKDPNYIEYYAEISKNPYPYGSDKVFYSEKWKDRNYKNYHFTKQYSKGGINDGGVTKNLKRIVRKGKKYGKLAVNKAKPKAKKIIRKAKLGFDALAKKVAQAYEGKKVAPKYQKQYGKTYSKKEAQEVGNKVAAKVKMMKGL